MPPDRSPQPPPPSRIDAHIGARVRSRRRALGFTQDLLAERIGVTAQQVHKYESGANRVAASKLYEIALILQAPVSYFFEGLPGAAGPAVRGRILLDEALLDRALGEAGREGSADREAMMRIIRAASVGKAG